MFSNLIESGSHAADLRRKGRFFIGTTLFYALLLCATGVGSIYAYNVRLDERTDYEVLAVMRFPPAAASEEQPRRETRPASSPARASQIATRTEISTQTPYHGDRIASATAREVGPKVAVALGRFDSDPKVTGGIVGPYVPGHANSRGGGAGPTVEDPAEGPPPTPTPRPTPAPAPTPKPDTGPLRLPSSLITSKVIDKPAPPYPQVARAAGVQGVVAVQILVDEEGRVVSAKAASGNPLLHVAAVQAAYRARFTPTLLSGKPVKVTGSITYNFLLR